MLEKTIDAKLDWANPSATTRRKASQTPFDFRYLGDVLVVPGTGASDVGVELEDITEYLRDLVSRWNPPTNTSGTIPALAVGSGDPYVDYVYSRNIGSRSWLDELCGIRPLIIEVFDDLFTTASALITKSETRETETRPAASLRQKELEWLSSNTGNLRNYEGKWIALEGDKIVASGSDEVAVEMRARMKGVKVPFLIRVPSKEDMLFIGHSLHDSNGIR